MRLLSTEGDEPQLRLFVSEPSRPPYAILSHTWMADEDEVQFSDMLHLDQAQHKRGWTKIMRARGEAKARGHKWIWIDTCCIDKSSSTELSESINSMFRWYRDAAECYVFLADFELGLNEMRQRGTQDEGKDEAGRGFENFKQCRWFKRGWTLQEMVAPSPEKVTLFDQDWQPLGTLANEYLGPVVSNITGVALDVFTVLTFDGMDRSFFEPYEEGRKALRGYSIAERMSWAADRETTRAEDRAYALFGMFGVNLPIVYGEGGGKAFLRLQEAIMRDYPNDPSIFGWDLSANTHSWKAEYSMRSLLAPSPDNFRSRRGVGLLPDYLRKSLEVTSTGVSIELLVISAADQESEVAILPCPTNSNRTSFLALTIEPLPNRSNEYIIRKTCVVDIYEARAPMEKRVKLLYRPDLTVNFMRPTSLLYGDANKRPDKVLVRFRNQRSRLTELSEVEPSDCWNSDECVFLPDISHTSHWESWSSPGLPCFRASFSIRELNVRLLFATYTRDQWELSLLPFVGEDKWDYRAALRFVPAAMGSADSNLSDIEDSELVNCGESALVKEYQSAGRTIEARIQALKLVYLKVFLLELEITENSPHRKRKRSSPSHSNSKRRLRHQSCPTKGETQPGSEQPDPSPLEAAATTPESENEEHFEVSECFDREQSPSVDGDLSSEPSRSGVGQSASTTSEAENEEIRETSEPHDQ